jgi:hypothetical protein
MAGVGVGLGTIARHHGRKEASVQVLIETRPLYPVVAGLFGIVAVASWDRPLVAAALVVAGLLALVPWWLAGRGLVAATVRRAPVRGPGHRPPARR